MRQSYMVVLLTLLLTASSAVLRGATITVSASCADSAPAPTTLSPGSATCNGPHIFASATVSGFALTTHATYTGVGEYGSHLGQATASYDADYLLTIHGGSGIGLFSPCLTIAALSNYGSEAGASASFGSLGISVGGYGQQSTCNAVGGPRLAFDVPTLFHLSLSALSEVDNFANHSEGATSLASFSPRQIYDLTGNVIPNATFTLAEIPEPSTFLYVLLTVIVLSRLRAPVRTSRT
jgi:hypothetical protein